MTNWQRGDETLGRYIVRRPSFARRLTMQSFDALPPGHNMTALIEIDVSDALAAIERAQAQGARVTLFTLVLAAIAQGLAEHRQLNSVRARRSIVEFEDVDINIPIELDGNPRQLVIRQAQTKDAATLYAEILAAKQRFRDEGSASEEQRWSDRIMAVALLLPKFIRSALIRWISNQPLMVKRRGGTVFVTSVAKFIAGSGFALPYKIGPMATSFALGSVARKPVARGEAVEIREILGLTIVFNHDIVDGAPAARFTRRLRERLEDESGSLLPDLDVGIGPQRDASEGEPASGRSVARPR